MTQRRRLFLVLALASFFLYFGFEIWQDVFNNYAVEQFGLNATQVGLIQSLRELPGLLGFVLAYLTLWLSEMRVMGLSVLLLGVGLVLSGWAQGLGMLIVSALVMSTGFHFFYPSSSSVVLMQTTTEEAPKTLGWLRSVSALAAVLATLSIWVFVKGARIGPLEIEGWGYRPLLIVTGAIVMAGGMLALRSGGRHSSPKRRHPIILRREYWLYYVLTFLMGSRRHIFSTFAIFLLVQSYHIDVRVSAVLFLVNGVVNTFVSPLFGVAVGRYGERLILTWNFIGLIGVFLGYAFVTDVWVLYALFVLDSVFFGFSLAVDTYFQKIALSPDEITSNVSLAQTINHISALVVPVLGGLLWDKVSSAATFLAGVIVVVLALALVQLMPRRHVVRPAASGDLV